MNIALSVLSDAAEQSVIDRLLSYGDAGQELGDADYWSSVGIIALTGILVVFLILAILIFLFWLLGVIFRSLNANREQKKETVVPAAPIVQASTEPEPEEEDVNDDEIIAVIAAAIAAYSSEDGTEYVIKSVKKRKGASRSAWSMAGIRENTDPFSRS